MIKRLSTNSKGQAAMEFMMTYGWALMMVLGVIAALVYFNFFNPSLFLPEKCDLGYRLRCDDYKIGYKSGTGVQVSLAITNIFPESIVIRSLNVSPIKSMDSFTCNGFWQAPGLGTFSLAQGEKKVITIDCSPALYNPKESGKIKFYVNTSYSFNDTGLNYVYTMYGELFTKIER
ncbi:MAG: hypothetical protein AABX51_03075 [Nanoarchaeota archaeon]